MRIATWNINGVKARLGQLLLWLEEESPDIVVLQELKSVDEGFPRLEVEALGYNVETHGQKSWNGVAILSKIKADEIIRGLPGDDADEQSRLIEGVFSVEGGVVRVCGIYLPNGNPVASGKFPYKLAWFERLRAHAQDLLAYEEPLVLCGDYNVIPTPADAKNPQNWTGDALYQPESQAAFRALQYIGLSEAGDLGQQPPGTFTFWDYQAGAWQRDNGIRIDFHLLSPQAADRFRSVETHRDARDMDKPSDHVPVVIDLDLDTPTAQPLKAA